MITTSKNLFHYSDLGHYAGTFWKILCSAIFMYRFTVNCLMDQNYDKKGFLPCSPQEAT